MGLYGFLKVLCVRMGPYKSLFPLMICSGSSWVLISPYASLWILVGPSVSL